MPKKVQYIVKYDLEEPWNDAYKDPNTQEFKDLARVLEDKVKSIVINL